MNVVFSRKTYVIMTLVNIGIFTILGGLFCRYLLFGKMEKYDFLHMIKDNIDNVIGRDNNRYYFIYFLLAIHTIYSVILIISFIFTPYIDIYIINGLIALFVVYTNLEYKGCLLRKYEKIVFNDSGQIDIGEVFPHYFFYILSKLFNYDFKTNDKVLSVMLFGFIFSIMILIRFMKLLRKYI